LADPIPYTYTASEFIGLGGLSYWSAPVTLPDLSLGGTVSLGTGIPAAIGPWIPDNNGTIHQTIDNGFSFQLRYFPTGTTPDPLLPRLDIEGHVSGYLDTTPSGDREGGTFAGTVTSINLINDQGNSDVPRPLLDLLAHPQRIHINANSAGYVLSQFDTILTIDPPDPQSVSQVPEPSTLATLLLAAIGSALRRWRRCSAASGNKHHDERTLTSRSFLRA
jgi:hypothetical protein